ncbi:MAG: PssE/Cps14G family polysaccharide biosynthesis glycosyltransferase [Clostridia bacterium]
MIFVTVGSQKFQFDRLLEKLDELCEKKIIEDKVFAQTGYCEYIPKNFEVQDFLDREEFGSYMKQADLVLTHAGTGAIMGGLKAGKKVIAVPRLEKYGEHVDDHQVQIVKEFEEMELIEACYDLDKLEKVIEKCKSTEYEKYISNTDKIVASLEEFINN